jgi:predicted outer membrane protein
MLMLADAPPEQTTMPRRPAADPVEQAAKTDNATPDPLFDRPHVATDDPAFILQAVENTRQGILDARIAAHGLDNPELRALAEKIGAQNEATNRRLEEVAHSKGWRLPQDNPARDTALPGSSAARANANFILSQLSFHQNTVSQYRAQIAGRGDPDLKRELQAALPGYEKNLDLLLKLKP